MKKSITISIPEPCHEDWAKMTPTEKGKFCSVCTKEVVDFTQTNDEDIVKRVQKGENLCGRFLGSQLDRPMTLERKSRNSLLPYAASLLFPLSLLNYQDAQAQNGASAFNKPAVSLNIGSQAEKSIVTITGQVTDEWGTPLPAVEVLVVETGNSVHTDFDGYYILKCPSGSTLSFLYENKKPYEATIGSQNSVVHAILTGEVPEIIIPHHIVGKIAPIEAVENGGIEVLEDAENEEIVIRGTVTDETGLPLPSVKVAIAGTRNKTKTNYDGNFEISTEKNETLVFSYPTYKDKEITLSNISNTIDISMDPDTELLVEVSGVHLGGVLVNHNSYSPLSQKENRQNRKEYTTKVNAFKKIKMERAKEARKRKRARKQKK